MERRHSTTSDSSNDSRQSLGDVETTAGRVGKTLPPKVATNPLQFVKVGPCDLYRSAQEQLKKVEEIKKAKKVQKDDVEDWQSNLDNWKCSRRKRQEHIIERVVEVKKFELEEHERNRKKSKTFSEMMEERNRQGRKASLPVYHNDEDDDLSELGITSHKTGSSDSASNADQASSTDGETTCHDETIVQLDKSLDKSAKDSKKAMLNSPSPPSPNESQEYTYEWAIQNYVNFAENRVKSKSTTNILDDHKKSNGREYPPIATKPVSTAKADNYLKSIDKNRSSPEERKTPVAAVPKVDISGRRQLFEKMQSPAEVQKNQRSSPETQGSKTIKDRLSFLGEQKKPENGQKDKLNGFPSEPLVKNRLMSIETISSTNGTPNRKSVEAITSVSVKDRLISLSKPDLSNATVVNSAKTIVEPSVSIKDRLTSLQSSIVKEAPKASIEILTGDGKRRNFKTDSKFDKEDKDYERSLSPDDGKRQDRHFRHRSLDSLDIDTENVASSSGSFERVQSLEDLDYRNYPPSTFSGDTDREDSGIHTADVSSSVSQADDYDLHLDGTIVDPHQPSIAEEVRSSASPFQPFQESASPSAVSPARKPTAVEDADVSCAAAVPTTATSSLSSVLTSSVSSKPHSPPPNSADSFAPLHSSLTNCLPSIPEVTNIPEIKTSVHTESHAEPVDDDSNCSWMNFENPVAHSTLLRSSVDDFISEELDVTVIPSSQQRGVNVEELCREFIEEERKCDSGPLEPTNIVNLPNGLDPMPIQVEANNLKESEFTIIGQSKAELTPNEISPREPSQFNGVIMDLYSETPQDVFNLNPMALEPPKEKPPPPPTELSDEEAPVPKPKASLRRLDSTKRIKKEIRQKRSSFLGIEGGNDESYLEPELELVRPPDMTALLAEERRMERQLYRQSICSESDSNQESRDSGVELDHKLPEPWSHSRNDSEVYGNNSTTSEEDEIMKKEREIIETLEEEEKIRKQDMENKLKLGETLAMKLRELEAEKERYEWESGSIPDTYNVDQQPQHAPPQPNRPPAPEPTNQPEPLLCRPEPVSCRQEPVPRRSIEALQNVRVSHAMYTQELKRPVPPPPQQDWPMMAGEVRSRESAHMANVAVRKSLGDLRRADQLAAQYRRSMPNLQEAPLAIPAQPRRPPPPPPISQHHQAVISNHGNPATQINSHGGQQMTRQTLQALSAAPRSRIISNDTWQAQAKRKQPRPDNCNYQHWLIQEAEHRRITEQHQRQMDAIQQRSANLQPLNGTQQLSHAQSHPCINSTKWHNVSNGNSSYLENGWSQPPVHHHPAAYSQQNPPQPMQRMNPPQKGKPLPDSIIQTLTQRVQRMNDNNNYARRRHEPNGLDYYNHNTNKTDSAKEKEKMLSVSGKKRCSNCGDELGRGAAMIIESLQLFYHIECFKCCVCCLQLGDGQMGTDVRVRNNKLHCHNCYSSDDGTHNSNTPLTSDSPITTTTQLHTQS